MLFPPNFDSKQAIELGNLVIYAYRQLEFFTNPDAYIAKYGKPWKLPTAYKLISTITYNRWQMGFDEEAGSTLIDDEIATAEQEKNVSFGIVDDVESLFKDYPMGFVATSKDGKSAYLIFRGTVTKLEFVKDAKIVLNPYLFCRESFMQVLKGLDTSMDFYISGHSLGAALSVLSLPDVAKATSFKSPTLYNFGCPRVGDNGFVTAYNALPGATTFRVVNSSDIVPGVPPPAPIYYSHVDTPVEFNSQNNDVSLNHSMDTYVKALGGKPVTV